MGLSAGDRLGPYAIVAPLGAGGMGEVYRATDTRLDRTVAIKVLPTHLSSNPDLRARFEREARAISSLQHPHICVLHDIGHESGTDYLVLEYLEGETLAERLRRGPIPLAESLRIGIEVADALDKAHRQGIMHRDLKPGNVMLTKSGAKLMDFGLAKPVSMAAASGGSMPAFTAAGTMSSPVSPLSPLTTAGSIVGTYQYMSPEQVQGLDSDTRSDIFAFGALLYEMVTGRRAFDGKSQLSVASAILEKEPEPITVSDPSLPAALQHILERCLAKDPADRFQSAREVALELQWMRSQPSTAASAPAAPAASRSRIPLWVVATGVLALVAMGVAAGWSSKRSPAPEVVRSALLPPPDGVFFSVDMAFSPDGKRLAFVARVGTTAQLWIRPLDSLQAQPLAGTSGANFPFWAPDGRHLGFFAEGKLKRVDTASGAVQVLCDAPDARGGAWGPNGTIIFAPGTTEGLYRVSAAGGAPSVLTKLDREANEGTHRWPQFLPDGRFLYLSRSNSSANKKAGIYIGSLNSEERVFVVNTSLRGAYAGGRLLFVRDDTLYSQVFDLRSSKLKDEPWPLAQKVTEDPRWTAAFAVSDTQLLYQAGVGGKSSQLAWVDRKGQTLEAVDFNNVNVFRLSPDGHKVVASVRQGDGYDLWTYDFARKTRTRLSFESGDEDDPQWSEDGNTIYFDATVGSENYNLYSRPADGSGAPQMLFKNGNTKYVTSASRDGKYLLFDHETQSGTKTDVYVITLDKRETKPFVATPAAEMLGELSPDGRWVAYTSDASGRPEVYVSPFPEGGTKYQVSNEGGTFPRWRGDGAELYYITPDLHITAVNVRAKGRAFEADTPSRLFAIKPFRPMYSYDVTRDGQRFLVNELPEQVGGPMVLVTNWAVDLKK